MTRDEFVKGTSVLYWRKYGADCLRVCDRGIKEYASICPSLSQAHKDVRLACIELMSKEVLDEYKAMGYNERIGS